MISIPKDQMTPYERMTAFSKGQAIDRVPICPFTGESFTNYFGHSLVDFNHSSDVIVDVVEKTFKRFKTDNCSIGPGLHGLPEAMGCDLTFYKDQIPQIKSSPLKDYQDLGWLRSIDPYKDGRLGLYLEALKRLQDRLKGQVHVGSTIAGPFTTAGLLIGTERFLRDLAKNPQGVKTILNVCIDNTLEMIKALMDIGISPGMADPLGSSHLISKKTYDKWVLPATRVCQSYIESRSQSGSVLHICGKTSPIWSSMVETGISGISLDNCDDIEDLKNLHGDQVTIIGNLDPVNTLYMGSRQDIYREVASICNKSLDSKKGFVLATGCDVALGTDPKQVDHFMNAGRIYGNLR